MSKPVQVSLGGQMFNLRTEDDPKHVQACAALVNERLDELRKKGAPDSTIGLFVAMTIADDLLKQRQRLADAQNSVRDRIQALRKAAG